MTEVDVFAAENFESKLNRLMEAYTQLAEKNAALREQLNLQSVELAEAREQYKGVAFDHQKRLCRLVRYRYHNHRQRW